MTFGFSAQRRTAAKLGMNHAVQQAIESLESRVLLSAGTVMHPRSHFLMDVAETATHHHKVALKAPAVSPTTITRAGIIRQPSAGPTGTTPLQAIHLYGIDGLDAYNASTPLFTNTGDGQTIVIIGSPAVWINNLGTKIGNINKFSAASGIPPMSPVLEVTPPGEVLAPFPDLFSQVETTMSIEWAHAFAPHASIILVQVNSVGGVVAPADLKLGIQEAITQLQSQSPGPINGFPPGGVVSMSYSSAGEDPATLAQFDALFNQAGTDQISFIASAGDVGGARSMPGSSPYVTSIGGTVYRLDGAGNRISETADLNSGGGQSFVETLPSFQTGLKAGRKLVTTRAVPDISLISTTRGQGVNVFFDPTVNRDDPTPWYTVDGTSVGAPIFAGMVTDANELRNSLGENLIGNTLNSKLYTAFHDNYALNFHDITTGNNTKYQAAKGYDLATGLGTPNGAGLIPTLAGIVGSQISNVTFRGVQIASIGAAVSGNAVTPFRGTGVASVGPQNAGLTLNLTSNSLGTTAVLDIPVSNRGLDNTLNGDGTVTVTNTLPTVPATTQTTVYNVHVTGIITGVRNRTKIKSGQIFTVDANGNRISQGAQSVFEGTFTSIS